MKSGEGFPKAPFQIRERKTGYAVARGLLILLMSLGAFVGLWGFGLISNVRHDDQVWEAGGPQVTATVSGKVSAKRFVFKDYSLELAYQVGATRYERPLRFATLFAGMDEDQPHTLRVLPTDAKEFAYGPAVDAAVGRYLWALVPTGFGVAMIVLAFAGLRALRRLVKLQRSLAARGQLVLVDLISREKIVRDGRQDEFEMLSLRVNLAPHPPRIVKQEIVVRGRPRARFAGDGDRQLLALVLPDDPSQLILLNESFDPLELSAEDAKRVRSAVASSGAPETAPS